MNRNLHRLIFNARRGQLMAVAETGGAGRGRSGGASPDGPMPSALPALGLILSAALLLPAHAQIVPDPAASAAHRPSVGAAPNGVPLVNITRPTAAGVSRNLYRQFDVDRRGAILNNSGVNVQTQLGGWVQGNPAVNTGGPARVIVNEIGTTTPANPTQLRGWVEVAGQRAQVVIANPAGIVADGAGFINASGAVLTTGVPQYALPSGDLDHYMVRRGLVRMEGAGFDTRGLSHADILARAVELNASIWAQRLNVVTGANQVSASHGSDGTPTATPVQPDASEPKPRYSLDVGHIGGMYAGHIFLIGTEAGLGVNIAGPLYAKASDFIITTDGRLELSASALAARRGHVSAREVKVNAGAVLGAGEQLTVQATQGVANAGVMQSGGALSVQAASLNNAGGTLAAGGTAQIDAGTLINNAGLIQTGGKLTVQGVVLHNEGGRISATGSASLTAQTLNNAAGLIVADGTLSVQATSLTNTAGTIAAGGVMQINAGTVSNKAGLIQSGTALNVQAAELRNTQGQISAGGALTVQTEVLNNEGGRISSTGSQSLTTQTLNSAAGLIVADGSLAVQASSLNNVAGTLASGGAMQINAGTVSNEAGLIQSGAALAVQASELRNAQGQINAGGALTVQTAALQNETGYVGSTGAVNIIAQTLNNAAGQIVTGDALTIQAITLTNTAGTLAAGGAVQLGTATLANAAGLIQSTTALTANTAALSNTAGLIASGGSASLTIAGEHTEAGHIHAATDLSLSSGAGLLIAQSGTISAGGNLTLQAQTLNSAGEIVAGSLNMQTAGDLTHRGLIDAGVATLSAGGSLSNTSSARIYADELHIRAQAVTNTGDVAGDGQSAAPVIASRGALHIEARRLVNESGALLHAAGDMTLSGAVHGGPDASTGTSTPMDSLTNRSARIEAAGTLRIHARQISNIAPTPQIVTTTGSLDTLGGYITTCSQEVIAINTWCDYNPNLSPYPYTNRWVGNGNRLASPQETQTFLDRYAAGGTGESGALAALGYHHYGGVPAWLTIGDTSHESEERGVRITVQASADEVVTGAVQGMTPPSNALIRAGGALHLDTRVDGQLAGEILNDQGRIESGGDASIHTGRLTNRGAALVRQVNATRHYERLTGQVQESPYVTSFVTTLGSGGGRISAGGALTVNAGDVNNETVTASSQQTQPPTQPAGQHLPLGDQIIQAAQSPGDANWATTQTAALAAAIGAGASAGATLVIPAPSAINTPGTAAPTTTALRITSLSAPGSTIATTVPALGVLTSALYRPTADPQAGYLIETDARYTRHARWLTSSYMLDALGIDPASVAKRIGDGYVEQQLVLEQLAQLTGRVAVLRDPSADDARFSALLNAGITYAREYNLRPGLALSAQQMAQLTTDMVWLVEREVRLPDGRIERALVPQLYARITDADLLPDGTLLDTAGATITAADVQIAATGEIRNSAATIAARRILSLNAQTVHNLAGLLHAQQTIITAAEDVNNIGARIGAEQTLNVHAGRDLNIQSTTHSRSSAGQRDGATFTTSHTSLHRIAALYVGAPGQTTNATLQATAGRDLNLSAAQIEARTAGSTGTTVQLDAGRDLNLGSVATSSQRSIVWDARNYKKSDTATEHASQISAGSHITASAGRDLTARGAALTSQSGALNLNAGRDARLDAAQSTHNVDEMHHASSSGFMRSGSTTVIRQHSQTTAQGVNLAARDIRIQAGQDVSATAATVVADKNVQIEAGRDVSLTSATDTSRTYNHIETRKSGLGALGGLSYGRMNADANTTGQSSQAAPSTIAALAGDIHIKAGNQVNTTAAALIAPAGDITITAAQVSLDAAREQHTRAEQHRLSSSGLSVGASAPLLEAAQRIERTARAAGDTPDPRMKALAAASAALQARAAIEALKKGQETKDGNAADRIGGASLNITLGTSRSQSSAQTTQTTQRESTIAAGRDVTIAAHGADQASTIEATGAQISAGRDARLSADGAINLQSAQATTTSQSSNSSSGSSIGVGISLGKNTGVTVNAAASRASGNTTGTETTHTNTRISAGRTVSVDAGDDITLHGATVTAGRVEVHTPGDLIITSPQDTASYEARQRSTGASLSATVIGTGGAGASISAARTNVSSTYASVGEQSAIRAGDAGFSVNVGGRTDLNGGAITSTQKAVDEDKNTFSSADGISTTDIRNSASYSASSAGATIGVGSQLGQSGAGIGNSSGNASSVTKAAVSNIAGDTAARTGDSQSGIKPIFNADAVRRDVEAQVLITQIFSQQAARVIGEQANRKAEELRRRNKDEGQEDETREAEARKWDEGGAYRVLAHAVLGALTGGASGAAGAGAAAISTPLIEQATQDLPEAVRSVVGASIAAGLGAVAGGQIGAVAALNADINNRQLHPTEEQWLRSKAKEFARQEGITEAQAIQRLTQQALREVDYLWRAQLTDGDDQQARTFLTATRQTFTNDLGEQQKLFTATGQQLLRPEMFADSANPAFYKQFAQSGISRKLNEGLHKELKDSGINVASSAADLAQRIKDNPARVANAVWDAVRNLPQSVVDGFTQTGNAIGEGAAVALSAELTAKLNAIYGTDTAGAQKAILAIRLTAAITGAAGTAKLATELVDGATAATSAKLTPAEQAVINRARIENNLYSADGRTDPAQPMTPGFGQLTAAEITRADAQRMILERIPLHAQVVKVEAADVLNDAVTKQDKTFKPPHVPGTDAVQIITTQPERFVRVYALNEKGEGQMSSWILKASDIQGLGPQQIASKYALPQVPTMMTDVTVPAGQTLRVSVANDIRIGNQSNAGNGGGGGVQFQVLEAPQGPAFSLWFSNPRPLQ